MRADGAEVAAVYGGGRRGQHLLRVDGARAVAGRAAPRQGERPGVHGCYVRSKQRADKSKQIADRNPYRGAAGPASRGTRGTRWPPQRRSPPPSRRSSAPPASGRCTCPAGG